MLSTRLQHLYDPIQAGQPLWDIGCDHGYVGLAAYRSRGRCPQTHLVDKSDRVVSDLQRHINTQFPDGHAGLHLWHHDAETQPLPILQGTLVLAGMGTDTILTILANLCKTRVPPDLRLVLSTNVNEERLRLALARRGWRLNHETLYRDKRHVRQVIVCSASGAPIHPFWNNAAHSKDHGLLPAFLQSRHRYLTTCRSTAADLSCLRQTLAADFPL